MNRSNALALFFVFEQRRNSADCLRFNLKRFPECETFY